MKRLLTASLLIVVMVGLATSCQQSDQPETLEEKKQQLDEYQKDLVDLKQKAKTLETDIKEIEKEQGIRQPKIAVKISPLMTTTFRHKVEVQGLVESDKDVLVSSEVAGSTTKVLVEIGDYVKAGDIIVKVDDQMLRNQLDELQSSYDFAMETYQKQKNLWDQNIGSQMQYLEAKNRKESLEKRMTTLRSQIDKYNIVSPISGKVDNVLINQGEMVSPGVPVAKIVDAAKVKIVADVSERYVGDIKKGDSVIVNIPAIGLSETSVIQATGQVINKENRTFKIMVRLDNKNGRLKPNLLAKITIYDYSQSNALVLPTRLIHFQDDSTYVYIAKISPNDTVAHKVGVNLTFSNAKESLVSSGLKKGDMVIVEGHDKVSEGDKINPVR